MSLTIDPADADLVAELRRLVDPDDHTDPTTFAIGLTHLGRTIINDEPGRLGARVIDRFDRTWEKVSDHDDAIWMLDGPGSDGGLDSFYDIQTDLGPLVEAEWSPIPPTEA